MPDDATILELASGYLDGALSAAERAELDRRLRADSGGAEAFGALLDVDAALQAELGEPDVKDRVLAGIAARHARGTSRRVLGAIRRRDAPGARDIPIGRPAPARRYGWRLTALAASVLIALGAMLAYEFARLGGRLAAPRWASLLEVAGDVRLLHEGREGPARAGDAVRVGDTIVTGTRGTATLAYADNCRFEAASETRLALPEPRAGAARDLLLETGAVIARIPAAVSAGAPVVSTRHAEMHVVGTVFKVTVLPAASRIDVEQGRVRVVNRRSGQSRVVPAGFRALVGEETVVAPAGIPRGERAGLQVLYTFEDGRGTRVRDVAGVGTPLDLTIEDETAVQWLPGGGLLVRSPTIVASERPARELVDACRASNELTVEAWFVSLDNRQAGPARILTLSPGPPERNFTLCVCHYVNWPGGGYPKNWGWAYALRLDTTRGFYEILSAPDILDTRLTHLVATRTAAGEVTLYLNGANVTGTSLWSQDEKTGAGGLRVDGTFADWNSGWRLALANEFRSEPGHARPWLGTYRLVAVYSRALTAEEVWANFRAGPRRRSPLTSADAAH